MTPSARDFALELVQREPVVLFVDAAHPQVRGLPPAARDRVLVVLLASPNDFADLEAWADGFVLAYGREEGPDDQAWLPWEAVFALAGTGPDGRPATRIQRQHIPACLQGFGPMAVPRLLNHLGLSGTPPGALEWHIQLSPGMLADDGDRSGFEPDKPTAFQRLIDHGDGRVVLLADPTYPGLDLPPLAEGQEVLQIPVSRWPPCRELEWNANGLSWWVDVPGASLRHVLPWRAVGAMRSLSGDLGWFWPEDLPLPARRSLQAHPELWPHVQRLQGVPLASDPQAGWPLTYLPAPNQIDRLQAVLACVRLGGCLLLANGTAPGVIGPPSLTGRTILAIPLGLPGLDPSARLDRSGLEATMPGAEGELVRVQVPWTAVFLCSTHHGPLMGAYPQGRVHCWPDAYPPALEAALFALRGLAQEGVTGVAQADGFSPLQRVDLGDGTTILLGRTAEGRPAMRAQQPIGPLQDDGVTRLQLELEFCLTLPAVN